MDFIDLFATALTMLIGDEGEWWFYFTPHPNYWEYTLQQAIN